MITKPPDGWLTNKLITSFNDDDFNESIISDDGPNKEIKDQYIEVMGSFFNTSFECEIKDIWYNYYKIKSIRKHIHTLVILMIQIIMHVFTF